MTACSAITQAIVQLPKPVVAAVQAIATAAGRQLVASGDLAVASAAAFANPGVDIGRLRSTPMVALSRNVPRKQAMETLLTGEPIPASTARQYGLANRVVAAGTNSMRRSRWRKRSCSNPPIPSSRQGRILDREAERSLVDADRDAAEVMTENMMARDARKALAPSLRNASRNGRPVKRFRHCACKPDAAS